MFAERASEIESDDVARGRKAEFGYTSAVTRRAIRGAEAKYGRFDRGR